MYGLILNSICVLPGTQMFYLRAHRFFLKSPKKKWKRSQTNLDISLFVKECILNGFSISHWKAFKGWGLATFCSAIHILFYLLWSVWMLSKAALNHCKGMVSLSITVDTFLFWLNYMFPNPSVFLFVSDPYCKSDWKQLAWTTSQCKCKWNVY